MPNITVISGLWYFLIFGVRYSTSREVSLSCSHTFSLKGKAINPHGTRPKTYYEWFLGHIQLFDLIPISNPPFPQLSSIPSDKPQKQRSNYQGPLPHSSNPPNIT